MWWGNEMVNGPLAFRIWTLPPLRSFATSAVPIGESGQQIHSPFKNRLFNVHRMKRSIFVQMFFYTFWHFWGTQSYFSSWMCEAGCNTGTRREACEEREMDQGARFGVSDVLAFWSETEVFFSLECTTCPSVTCPCLFELAFSDRPSVSHSSGARKGL